MIESFGEKGKKLNLALVDLEKAYDRVPREVTKWAMRKAGVEEWIVSIVMAMYEKVWSVVKLEHRDSDAFEIKVGLPQGSVFQPPFVHYSNECSFERQKNGVTVGGFICG